MYKMQDIKKDWESNKNKDIEWANQGVIYAKFLRKKSSFSEAIIVCEKVLSEFPDFRKAISQYGWNLYSEFIKSPKKQRLAPANGERAEWRVPKGRYCEAERNLSGIDVYRFQYSTRKRHWPAASVAGS